MFEGLSNGWSLVRESFRVFNRYPRFLVPLLLTWLVFTPIILYLHYLWDPPTVWQASAVIAGAVFLFAFMLSFSCLVLLELIQQLESGRKISITRAAGHAASRDLVRTLPIVLIWTIVWLLLLLVQALLPKKKQENKESLNAENAARLLSGYGSFSLSRAFFEALEKGVRMVVFLILPAIAWENLGFYQSVKKGLVVFRANLSSFVAGFLLTTAAAAVLFLPPAILLVVVDQLNIAVEEWVWFLIIVYCAFGWSYSMYLEQMFTAELYLWHYKWEKEAARARQEGRPVPAMGEIARPSVLDEVYELVEK